MKCYLYICFVNGIYCEKMTGYVCHKTTNQKLYYTDECKKKNLEKVGYIECQ